MHAPKFHLTARQKHTNLLISKKHYIVEQCFGPMKQLFGMPRARYWGTGKISAQVLLKETGYEFTQGRQQDQTGKHPGCRPGVSADMANEQKNRELVRQN
jgi:hypothetical protein